MIRQKILFLLATLLYLSLAACAPRDNRPQNSSNPTPAGPENPVVPETKVELPYTFKERLDATLQHVRQRELNTSNGFWTVFHGILGTGPDNAMLFNTETGNKVKAFDYIRNGGTLRGLEFSEMPTGLDVVTREGTGTFQGHQDQFVAEMVQWGVPRDTPFLVRGKKYTFEDFIRHSRDRASVTKKQELSWAILIIGQNYGLQHRWTNQFKEELSFEDVVRYEVKQPIGTAACGGTHRLFGLSWVYHLHLQQGGKKEGVWQEVAEHLDKYQKLARDFQNRDGSFSTKYVSEPGSETDPQLRINTTGHVLEWLALALPDEELGLPWMQNAAEALVKLILDNSSRSIDGGSLYHAAHGLAIYRTRLFGPIDSHPPQIPLPPAKSPSKRR